MLFVVEKTLEAKYNAENSLLVKKTSHSPVASYTVNKIIKL
jgi:hypothetical protein